MCAELNIWLVCGINLVINTALQCLECFARILAFGFWVSILLEL